MYKTGMPCSPNFEYKHNYIFLSLSLSLSLFFFHLITKDPQKEAVRTLICLKPKNSWSGYKSFQKQYPKWWLTSRNPFYPPKKMSKQTPWPVGDAIAMWPSSGHRDVRGSWETCFVSWKRVFHNLQGEILSLSCLSLLVAALGTIILTVSHSSLLGGEKNTSGIEKHQLRAYGHYSECLEQ